MKTPHAKWLAAGMSAAGVLVILAGLVFALLPTWQDIEDLTGQIVKANADLLAQYNNRRRLLSNLTAIEQHSRTIASLSEQFLKPEDRLDFIKAIEDIAAARGVRHEVRLTDGAHPSIPAFSQTFELTFEGPYASVLGAITDLERSRFLTAFSAAEVRPGRSEGAAATMNAVLQGYVATPPAL